MVRATYARVLIRLGGEVESFWTEAKINNLCTQADYIIDGFTNPETISTTDNGAIEIAVDVVLRMMKQADIQRRSLGASSGGGFTYPDISILSSEIKERINSLLSESYHMVTTIDMLEDT